ncbi:histidinol dehydrogenase [Geodermatophilus sp. Leaf369]|uniref:histidinol dehydrogenase n=1 Tax=Geodermatophilus sp. Leaf369 TaxID=1736354 RepID=UPI0006F73B74|nr:histidinol dehydrogenase [Geodermatophilus sp. Leaf369]KQS59670.1 histidinol dehydrogenase [Geodermatophilus sp. Leaf369]QNG38335.1 histidinol dehydrogenase [Geodermatophilaceae bacterium NBWT11]
MLARIDLRDAPLPGVRELTGLLPRAATDIESVLATVRPVCEDVRLRGAQAVREITLRFDGVDAEDFAVPQSALDEALASCDPALREALEEAVSRVRKVHADQRRTDVTTQVVPGGTVTERWVPVRRVGLYVPGGLAPLLSSVVMNVVPAQIAGVESIAVATPPQRDNGGLPDPGVLAACALLGVTEVYAVGGAQAIAVFGYGAGSCEPVDLVTGPGNVYVTAAKRLLRGLIGIDSEAGPTEVAVLADDTADPVHVAADLISQAEHDPLAGAVLVTTSEELADAVLALVPEQVAATKHSDRITTALGGSQSGIVLVDDLDAGLAVVDAYAAEHLEIQTRDARAVAMRVRNAGAVFVGPWSPVSLGDYAAGSNHVLPTGGCARHSSGLSVQTFLRGIHLIDYDEAALADVARHVDVLAHAEDLPAHAAAVAVRQK